MFTFSQKFHSILAVGLLVGIVIVTYFLIVFPIVNKYQENVFLIENSRHNYSRYKQIAEGANDQNTSSTSWKSENYKSNFYAGGSNDAVVANIQKRVKLIAVKNGAQFRSARALPPKLEGNTQSLGVRIEFVGKLEAIKKTLFAVETARPFLIIEAVQFKSANRGAGPTNTDQLILVAQLDVFGTLWPELKP